MAEYNPTQEVPTEEPDQLEDGLATLIRNKYEDARDYRTAIETDRWLPAEDAYNGIYVDTLTKHSGASPPYMNLTRREVTSAHIKINGMLFQNNKIPFTIKPSRQPRFVPADIHQMAEQMPQMTDKERTLYIDELSKHLPLHEIFRDRAKNMEDRIRDILDQTDFTVEIGKAVHEMCLHGTGVLKSPVLIRRNYPVYSGKFRGRLDLSLTPVGLDQQRAHADATRLKSSDKLTTPHLGRCHHLANVVGESHAGTPVVTHLSAVGAGALLTLAGSPLTVVLVLANLPVIVTKHRATALDVRLKLRAAPLVVTRGSAVSAGDCSVPRHRSLQGEKVTNSAHIYKIACLAEKSRAFLSSLHLLDICWMHPMGDAVPLPDVLVVCGPSNPHTSHVLFVSQYDANVLGLAVADKVAYFKVINLHLHHFTPLRHRSVTTSGLELPANSTV